MFAKKRRTSFRYRFNSFEHFIENVGIEVLSTLGCYDRYQRQTKELHFFNWSTDTQRKWLQTTFSFFSSLAQSFKCVVAAAFSKHFQIKIRELNITFNIFNPLTFKPAFVYRSFVRSFKWHWQWSRTCAKIATKTMC